METLELAKEYYREVKKNIANMTMVLYGSTVFGVNNSDLDLCFITENELDSELFNKLKEFTYKFHDMNNLKIDEEIPYDNKLVYTKTFINNTLETPPFPYYKNKFYIPSIRKDIEFLSSIEMRKRLLLNILTVKHIVMGDKTMKIENYCQRAWEIILKTVISYSEEKNVTLDKILECLYFDPFNQNIGEMYLGYKTNLQEKIDYIYGQVNDQLDRLVEENKITKTLEKIYIPKESWLKDEKYN